MFFEFDTLLGRVLRAAACLPWSPGHPRSLWLRRHLPVPPGDSCHRVPLSMMGQADLSRARVAERLEWPHIQRTALFHNRSPVHRGQVTGTITSNGNNA